MNSVTVGIIVLFYFIGVICDNTQNRLLIRSFKNDTVLDEQLSNLTFGQRRRLRIIDNFNGGDSQLLGVAILEWKKPNGQWFRACTGAYVTPPQRGATGKYVLTAAHCTWDKTANHHRGKWKDRTWRVQFGVTVTEKGNPVGPSTTCDVVDIRIPDEYTWKSKTKGARRYDYAIWVLGGDNCNPTHPFTITNFVNSWATQNFKRAGYGVSNKQIKRRQLTVHMHERMRKPDLKKANPDKYAKLLITEGHGTGGDSGGPMFNRNNELQAIYSGRNGDKSKKETNNRWSRAVKIYKDVHDKIDDFMRGIDGISPNTKKCKSKEYKSSECWSKCVAGSQAPNVCFSPDSKRQIRDFATPKRKKKCKKTGETGVAYRWLCGPIKACDASMKDIKRCSSKCLKGTGQNNACGVESRIAKYHVPCKGTEGVFSTYYYDGTRSICKKNNARLDMNNFIIVNDNDDDIYYDDEEEDNDENEDDEFYYKYSN